jgi:hypothetical protein
VSRFASRIYELARGPYITFIPDLAACSALYSREDREPLDFYRDRSNLKESESYRVKIERGSPSLADHVQGLNELDVTDLVTILNSSEKREFDQTLVRIAGGKEAVENLGVAAAAYLRVVDAAILGPNKKRKIEPSFIEVSNSFCPSSQALDGIAKWFLSWACKQADSCVDGSGALLTQMCEFVAPMLRQKSRETSLVLGLDLPEEIEDETTSDVEMTEELANRKERRIIQYKKANELRPQTAQELDLGNETVIQLTDGLLEARKTEFFGR